MSTPLQQGRLSGSSTMVCNTGFARGVHEQFWSEDDFKAEFGLDPDEDLEEALYDGEFDNISLEMMHNYVDHGFMLVDDDG